MSSKIAKVTVLIIAVALILVEVAPRWQLRAANDEDLTTTEISVDNGTGDDPDNAPEQEKPAVTPKPAQTAAPAKKEPAKPKADDSGKGKAADAGKSQVAKNRKHAAKHKNKKHHPEKDAAFCTIWTCEIISFSAGTAGRKGVRCGEGEAKIMAIHSKRQTSPSVCGYLS